MKYYHGAIIREGKNIDIDGFVKEGAGYNSPSGLEINGIFFTTSLKYACLNAGATQGAYDGEVWMIDTDENPELEGKFQLFASENTNPDWSGYFEGEEVDEYILPWEYAEGFIPECVGDAKELWKEVSE